MNEINVWLDSTAIVRMCNAFQKRQRFQKDMQNSQDEEREITPLQQQKNNMKNQRKEKQAHETLLKSRDWATITYPCHVSHA